MKPEKCRCGAALTQPATGRPRRYCSTGCRRSAEYEVRRLNSYIVHVRKQLAAAEVRVLDAWSEHLTQKAERVAAFWTDELEESSAALDRVLADLSDVTDTEGAV